MKKIEAMELAPERSKLLCEYITQILSDNEKILSDNEKVNGEIKINFAKINNEHMITFDILIPSKNNDIDCISNDRDETDKSNENYDFVKQYISKEYSIYEKIINLCDLMCTTKVLAVDKRMIDLLYRHGVYAKTHYHIEETIKLKEYFDNLLGYNLYDLFPEIKENL